MVDTRSAIEEISVREALDRVEQGERDSLEGLRLALCRFVSALRAEGATREEATGAVTALLMKPASPAGSSALLAPAREALIQLSTHWCAAEFGSE